MLTVQILWIW